MVKKKGAVWDFFNIKGKGVVCKYCTQEYKQGNAVKMEKHIKKCIKCPAGLKHILTISISKPTLRPLTVAVDLDANVDQTTQGQAVLTSAGLSSATSPFKSPTPHAPKPWPSPLSAHSSSSSGSATIPIYSPGSSRGITAFLDHMDMQTNVSLNHLRPTILWYENGWFIIVAFFVAYIVGLNCFCDVKQ